MNENLKKIIILRIEKLEDALTNLFARYRNAKIMFGNNEKIQNKYEVLFNKYFFAVNELVLLKKSL